MYNRKFGENKIWRFNPKRSIQKCWLHGIYSIMIHSYIRIEDILTEFNLAVDWSTLLTAKFSAYNMYMVDKLDILYSTMSYIIVRCVVKNGRISQLIIIIIKTNKVIYHYA